MQALELEVLEVGLVALIKISAGAGGLHAVAPHEILQNHLSRIEGAKVQGKSCQGAGRLLRVAASSNSHMQMIPGYLRMLEKWAKFKVPHKMTAEQLQALITASHYPG